jgi:putative peptidoglycan lipid II flippase
VVATRLGAGANSTLGYATRLTGLAISLGALAVSRALLPALSRVAEAGPRRSVAFQWSVLLFAAGLATALGAWAAAPWGIRLFYQHGQFHAGDTAAVTNLFRLSLTQLPFYFAGMAMVQLLASTGDYRAFAAIGVGALAVKIGAVAALVGPLGLGGVILSTALMYLFTFAALCWRIGPGAPR